MFGTLLALGAAIAVSGTVGRFLPHTQWGRFLSLVVFVYTMAPVFRRTVMRDAPEMTFEKSYWMMSAIVVTGSTLLDAIVKPPFTLAAAVVTVCVWIAAPLAAWIMKRLSSSHDYD
jgi:hypothetical protein